MIQKFFVLLFFIVSILSQEYEVSLDGSDKKIEEIHIGGLFEKLDGADAKAFELAVNYVNDKELIPGKRLVAEINEVSASDSFEVGRKVCELLKTGIAGIFGPSSADTASHVQSLCDTLELPHITTRWDLFQRRSSCLANVYPHPSTLSQAIRDVVEAWNWKGFTVLYDDYDALRKIHGLLKLADDKGYLVTVRQLGQSEEGNYRELLKEIKHSEEKNIVLECSVDILYDVLIQAQQVGLVGSDYSYIITTLDFHTIDYSPFMWAGTNITSLRIVNPEDPYVQEIATIWAENAEGNDTLDVNGEGSSNTTQETDEGEEDQEGEGNGPIEEEDNYYNEPDEEKKIRRWTDKARHRRQNDNENHEETLGDAENNDKANEDENNPQATEETPVSSTEIPPTEEPPSIELPQVTVDAALIHDAVILFSKAIEHLDTINFKSIDCNEDSSLDFGYSVINYMKLSEFQGLTGLVKFDHEGFRTDVLLEIIELTEEGISRKGIWNRTLSLIYPECGERPDDPGEDLRNTTFIVLIALTHPYNMLKEDSKTLKGNERYEGFGVDLIHELSVMSGFNYTFKEQVDKSSGNPTTLPNGTRVWNGMIGEVQAGRADLAIADITITRERERDADFTMPFMNLGISILHRKPTKAPPSLFSFLSPFSKEVWAYMMSAYIGVSLLFFVMARISPAEWTNPYPCIEEPEALENQFSLINSFWFTVGSLMQQGSDVAPIATSTRMAASIWWFFTLIMVSSYTANLAAFLTIESVVEPFKDIEELANQNVIKYGAKKGGATANFFRDSSDPIHKKIFAFMEANPDCMMNSNEAGVNRVCEEEKYAFFMESTSIEYETQRKCSLTQVGGLLDNKGYGIVMKQNSTYRNVLSKNVVQLQEKGKLSQLYDKWWKEKRGGGACSGESATTEASELNLENVGGVYVVLLAGCIFSIFITACELLWDIYTRETKRSFKEEFMEEFKFIMKCKGTVKPIRQPSESTDADGHSKKSRSVSSSSSFG